MSGSIFDAFGTSAMSPGIMGLLGMAQGFGAAAMPQPYKGGTPFGAALGMAAGGLGQGVQNAYKTQLEQAQAQAQQMQNTAAQSALPLTLAKNQMLTNIWKNPGLLQQLMGASVLTSPSDSSAPNAQNANAPVLPVSASQAMPGLSATSQAAPKPVQSGPMLPVTGIPSTSLVPVKAPSGATAQVASDAAPRFQGLFNDLEAAGYKLNPSTTGGFNDRFIAGTTIPSQHAYGRAVDVNWDKNPNGTSGPADIPAPLANSLAQKWGLTWGGNWSGKDRDPMHFEVAGNAPPVAAAGGAAPSAVPASSGAPTGASVSPGSAMTFYAQYEDRARRAALAQQLGLPSGDDPAVLHATAQQFLKLALAGPQAGAAKQAEANVDLATAGPIQREKSINSNVDVRQNSMVRVINPDGSSTWLKNPGVIETTDAAGNMVPMHVSPSMPGAPPGTAGTAEPILGPDKKPVITKLPPQIQEQRDEAAKTFAGKEQDEYQAAQNTKGWLAQITHAADTMQQAGSAFTTGPFAPQRLAIISGINDLGRTLGVPKEKLFDQNALASWEELKKATTTAGFELSSHYEGHARQAAQTIQNATSAVPAETNSPQGLRLVSSGISEGANVATDMHEYKQLVNDATQGAGLTRAETDYMKAHPPTQYTERAVSNIKPVTITDPKALTNYLPGTFFTDGKISPTTGKPRVFQVPERVDTIGSIQFPLKIPSYMQQQPPQAANGQ